MLLVLWLLKWVRGGDNLDSGDSVEMVGDSDAVDDDLREAATAAFVVGGININASAVQLLPMNRADVTMIVTSMEKMEVDCAMLVTTRQRMGSLTDS